jgi:glycosyltransferase involved in cell wall biosynthesis
MSISFLNGIYHVYQEIGLIKKSMELKDIDAMLGVLYELYQNKEWMDSVYFDHSIKSVDILHFELIMISMIPVLKPKASIQINLAQGSFDEMIVLLEKHGFSYSRLKGKRAVFFNLETSQVADIKWCSFLNAPSGISESARSLLRALHEKKMAVKAYSLPHRKATDIDDQTMDALNVMYRSKLHNTYINIEENIPEYLKYDNMAEYNIARLFFEVDKTPESWQDLLKNYDELWVPCDFVKQSFINGKISEEKIHIIPECIDTRSYLQPFEAFDFQTKKNFIFLSIFDFRLQKGWDVLIESFVSSFSDQDDVCLVLKSFSSAHFSSEDIKDAIFSYIKDKMKVNIKKIPKIIFIDEILSAQEMRSLIGSCHCFVLPSRGEGWGRPYMESMLMGKPVIATRWSGNLAFMNDENSFLIDCQVEKVSKDGVTEIEKYDGANWANPSADHLKELLKYVYLHYSAAKKKGEKAQKDILEHYNLEIVGKKMKQRLEKIKEVVQQPKKILLEGYFFFVSSMSQINRDLVKKIQQENRYDIRIRTNEDLALVEDKIQKKDPDFIGLTSSEYNELKKSYSDPTKEEFFDYTIVHRWPLEFKPPQKGYYILMAPWEYGSLPCEWMDPFQNLADCIWVYSKYLKETYVGNNIDPDKISIIHPFVDSNIFREEGPKYDMKTDKKFKFLFVGGSIPRKGIDNLINAYLNEFRKEDDVCLVVKDVCSNTFYKDLNISQNLKKLSNRKDLAEVLYIENNFPTSSEMASLYRACDCLVHPYKAEGFALPIAEAMACAKPVIVTGYGACLDYCNEKNAYLLKYNIEKFDKKAVGDLKTIDYPFWAEVEVSDLKSRLREVYENYGMAREKAFLGKKTITDHFGIENTLQEIQQSLKELKERKIVRFQKKQSDKGQDAVHSDPNVVKRVDLHREHPIKNFEDSPDKVLLEEKYSKALALLSASDKKGAKNILQEIIQINPGHKPSYKSLSDVYFSNGQTERAVKVLADYLMRYPKDDEFLNIMGVSLLKASEAVLAKSFFEKALYISPDNATVRNNLLLIEEKIKKSKNRRINSKYLYLKRILEHVNELPSIALCMIIKNEQKDLPDCLNSVKDIVNEIIIVDTGSTDDSVKIAKEYGAVIRHYKWDDDFSAARNKSIEDVQSEWILFLDADETLEDSSKDYLRQLPLAVDQPAAYYVKNKNILDRENDEIFTEHYNIRLFKNNKGITFQGRIHEQLVCSQGKEIERMTSDIVIKHKGYLTDVVDAKNKNKRNFVLLEESIKMDPDNPFHYHNLGIQYYAENDFLKAIQYFKKTIEKLNGQKASYLPFCYAYISNSYNAIKQYMDAIEYALKALEIAPGFNDAYFSMANTYFKQEKFEESIQHYKKAMIKQKKSFYRRLHRQRYF